MVNEVSLKKAQNLRRKSMSVGMRFLNEKIAAEKFYTNQEISLFFIVIGVYYTSSKKSGDLIYETTI